MHSGKLEVFSTRSLNHGIEHKSTFAAEFPGVPFKVSSVNFDSLVPSSWVGGGAGAIPAPQSVPVDSSSRVLLAQPLHGRVEPQVLLRGELQPQRVLLGAVPQECRSLVLGASSISPLHQHLHNQAGHCPLTQPCPAQGVVQGEMVGFRWGNPQWGSDSTLFSNINVAMRADATAFQS